MPEERRLVTVLFADIVGSTSLGDALDPEDLRALLTRYYGIARDVIGARGGTVEKFIGDAVMAVFGLPAAHDDDPSRALDAAIELRDAVQRDPVLGDRTPIRIGVNTGEVVAAVDTEARDFLVTGDMVNVAARLQQTAEPWQIVCSDRTARAAGDAFALGEPISVDARGKPVPLRARQVLGRQAPSSKPRLGLIGRSSDLAQLDLLARRAFGERRPYMVSVIAPPGTGKTRLLEAFLDSLPGIEPRARLAVAQCLPYGQRLTYWPLRALIEALADIDLGASPDGMREALATWLRDLGDADAERTADQLSATLGTTELEVVDQNDVFAAWRHAIETAAAHQPIVLAVEDLHWSSESLLDLLEFIFQPRPDVPLLMLALSRPELLDRRPSWGGGRRNYVSLALEPLGDEEIRQLVASLLEDPAPEVVGAVVKRADGNPFYAGELVRSLIESETRLNEPEAVADALGRLPDTVQATVLARLDLLPPVARRTLQLGSVIGRTFRHEAVESLEAATDAARTDALELLVDREMLVPETRGSYTFRHILIREVAYQTLPRVERARLHAAAGRYLEGLSGEAEERAELVAFHFQEAATLTSTIGEPATELRASAVQWLRRAAETAARGGANREAARHIRAAIELALPEDLPELYRRLGEVSWWGNRSADAFAEAYRLGRELGRPPDFLLQMIAEQLTVLMRWHASVAEQPSEAELDQVRQEGRRLLDKAQDERARATFLISQAFLPFWIRNNGRRLPTDAETAETQASAKAGLALAEKLGDPRLITAALDGLTSFIVEDDPAAAREMQWRRWQFANRVSLLDRSDAYQMVAWQSALLGDIDETLRSAEIALADVARSVAPEEFVGPVAWKTWALAMLGRWGELWPAVSLQRQMWVDGGRPSAGHSVHGPMAAAYAAAAMQDEPLLALCRELTEGVCSQFSEDHPVRDLIAIPTFDLDRVADRIVGSWERYIERLDRVALGIAVVADRGHPLPDEALVRLISRVEPRKMRWIEAEARRARALAAGDPEELQRAVALLEGTNAHPRIARAQADLARMVGDQSAFQEAARKLEQLGDVESLTYLARSG
jgi:class 3 adenylate cyclase